MTQTYDDLMAQTNALIEQEIALRTAERDAIIGQTIALCRDHGITADELRFAGLMNKRRAAASRKSGSGRRVSVGVPKYQDPKTGATWTGRGQAPAWILAAKNRDRYLIAG